MSIYICRDCGEEIPEDRRLPIASPLLGQPDRRVYKCPRCRGRLDLKEKGHSPGPWKIMRSSEYTGDPEDTKVQSIQAANGRTVYYTESGYFTPREEDVALIESSPDLLRDLKDLLDSHFDMSPLEYAQSRGLPFMSDEEGEKILARCRATIARAERRGPEAPGDPRPGA